MNRFNIAWVEHAGWRTHVDAKTFLNNMQKEHTHALRLTTLMKINSQQFSERGREMEATGALVIKLLGIRSKISGIQDVFASHQAREVRTHRKKSGECCYCHKPGHWVRKCRKKKYDLESRASAPLSLTPLDNKASAPVLDNCPPIAPMKPQKTRFRIQ